MNEHIARLEQRRLLAAQLNGSTLSINGTDDGETIRVEVDGGNYAVSINSVAQFFAINDVNRIRIFADDGDDTVIFGSANNPLDIPVTVYGSGGNDDITGYGTVEARFRVYAEGGNDDVLLHGQSRDHVYGEDGDDTIGTNGGRDHIFGGDSNDDINAGSGNDRIIAGSGNDIVNGGRSVSADAPAKDYIDAGEGDDTVNGGNGNDIIFGRDGNDLLYGGTDRDFIDGGEGVDTIYGQSGNDTILGGGSNDELYGGPNADRFSADELDDEVKDFDSSIDRIVQ